MLKTIAQPAPELASFIEALNLPLSRPQQRHVTQIADSLITIEGNKTLSAMYRHIVGAPCSKSAADTFREAPWRADDLRISLREFLVQAAFTSAEAEAAPKRVFLSLDDSLTDKDNGSRRLQAVDWHYDHTHALPQRPAYTKGTVYVMLRLSVGNVSFTVDMALYLRAKTVRRLNRARKKGGKLTFRTKIQIARQMLETVAPLIPQAIKSICSVKVGMRRHRSSSGAALKIGMSFAGCGELSLLRST